MNVVASSDDDLMYSSDSAFEYEVYKTIGNPYSDENPFLPSIIKYHGESFYVYDEINGKVISFNKNGDVIDFYDYEFGGIKDDYINDMSFHNNFISLIGEKYIYNSSGKHLKLRNFYSIYKSVFINGLLYSYCLDNNILKDDNFINVFDSKMELTGGFGKIDTHQNQKEFFGPIRRLVGKKDKIYFASTGTNKIYIFKIKGDLCNVITVNDKTLINRTEINLKIEKAPKEKSSGRSRYMVISNLFFINDCVYINIHNRKTVYVAKISEGGDILDNYRFTKEPGESAFEIALGMSNNKLLMSAIIELNDSRYINMYRLKIVNK